MINGVTEKGKFSYGGKNKRHMFTSVTFSTICLELAIVSSTDVSTYLNRTVELGRLNVLLQAALDLLLLAGLGRLLHVLDVRHGWDLWMKI